MRTPVVDFDGVVLVEKLEIGSVVISGQRIPAIRFVLRQSGQEYRILATGKLSGEVYAYSLAAVHRGWKGLEARVLAFPRPIRGDELAFVASGNEHSSGITWYSGSELRAEAARHLVSVLNGELKPIWPVREEPFFSLSDDR
jgi:hypothetical protein